MTSSSSSAAVESKTAPRRLSISHKGVGSKNNNNSGLNNANKSFNTANKPGQTRAAQSLLEFELNSAQANSARNFPDNVVRTSKYTLLTFLPLNLFEQFRRIANAYFLLIVIIQTIPNVSPFPIYTSLAPLIFILFLSAANEGREDYARHKADKMANSRPATLVEENTGALVQTLSAQLAVGQILKIKQGQEFPADLILLATNRADSTCYVNTANLDGEAAPKVRYAPQATLNYSSPELLAKLQGTIQYEQPSTSLYRFQGTLNLKDKNGEDEIFGLGDKQLLLRGSRLVNTEWVLGLIVYTGRQTKMMLNRNPARFKFSRFAKQINTLLMVSLVLNLFICLVPSIYYSAISPDWERQYGVADNNSFLGWLLGFVTQYILFSFMIPISMNVTVELIKVAQSKFMEWDSSMQYTNPDTGQVNRAVVKSSALTEELGHIDCICSDKTGTFTQNRMQLSRCSVAQQLFFDRSERHTNAGGKSGDKLLGAIDQHKEGDKLMKDMIKLAFQLKNKPNISHSDDEKFSADNYFVEVEPNSLEYHCREFLYSILLCNAVLPDQKAGSEGKFVFQSQSPDEIALLEALDNCGVTLIQRSGDNVKIRFALGDDSPVEFIYNILATLEFSSTWRRMCVVARHPDNSVHFYVKGADSTIEPLCEGSDIVATTMMHATSFAGTGSRTLVMAGRTFSDEEWDQWRPTYKAAETSMIDRDSQIEQSFRLVEKNLSCFGCSAVDDQLQEFVPETIDFLIKANVKVVMLTGDKLETAVTISRHSNLVAEDVKLLFVAGVTAEETLKSLQAAEKIMIEDETNSRFALAIDGLALEQSLMHHEPLFLTIFKRCETIVCYRSTPMQKAMVVKMCKEKLNLCTLAIGDGANDVSMIQEAHVGVGIYGKEGAHAAMSSDFVIYRFYHLIRLMCLHGRWSYWRTSQVIMFSFYKNMAFPFPLFWHQFWNNGSGTTMFDALLISSFNTLFTSLPPFFAGFMDKDVGDSTLLRYPQAYAAFKQQDCFSIKRFVYTLIEAFYHSIILYFFVFGVISGNDVIEPGGTAAPMTVMGGLSLTAVVIVENLWMLFSCAWITSLNLFGFAFGLVLFSCEQALISNDYNTSLSPDGFAASIHIYGNLLFYLYILVTVLTCLIPTVGLNIFNRYYHPKVYQVMQRIPLIDPALILPGGAEVEGVEIHTDQHDNVNKSDKIKNESAFVTASNVPAIELHSLETHSKSEHDKQAVIVVASANPNINNNLISTSVGGTSSGLGDEQSANSEVVNWNES
jgi:phospholipid-transporting ATPase